MKKGVLLVNLGSPDSPSVPDVRRYLREFLMDKRVLDVAWPVRFCVVNFAILPSRPKQSAHAYQSIWTPEGSPLVAISRKVHATLKQQLSIPLELAMRYQNPSIQEGVKKLKAQGVDELLLIPLFPHYAMSSFETAVERVKVVTSQLAPNMTIRVEPPFYDNPEFITALGENARPYLDGGYDHLLFSFHGLPERHLKKSDPSGSHCLASPQCCQTPNPTHDTCYRAQCHKTVSSFVARANIPEGKYSIAFQSRLGRTPWLRPYTDFRLLEMPGEKIQNLLVMCPSFVSDCLETLEEIGIRGRTSFIAAGGKSLTLIPCLNEHPSWIKTLNGMIQRFLEN
jgi:protoporphyrin/coproporphyrin ferrochelatase